MKQNLSGDAARILADAEARGHASYTASLRNPHIPYGDTGRAMDELRAAGLLVRDGDRHVFAGGVVK